MSGSSNNSGTIRLSLGRATTSISKSFERLSSGNRIVSPSDDAASSSIAAILQANTRVYTQGIRNISDGVSLVNTASEAVSNLKNIIERQNELASQAANDSYTPQQRQALNTEARALTDEFNRIIETTTFNSQQLLTGEYGTVQLQSGYGSNGVTQIAIGEGLERTVGSGTYTAATTTATDIFSGVVLAADLNGDGNVDLLNGTGSAANELYVYQGNGNGTFSGPSTYGTGVSFTDGEVGDIDSDGDLDLVVATATANVSILTNNGDGTFAAFASHATPGATGERIRLRDLNGDDNLDLVVMDNFVGTMSISLGNGDGTFAAATNTATGAPSNTLVIRDFNEDGIEDIVLSGGDVEILMGNGDGTFQAGVSFGLEIADNVEAGDYNNDGHLDIAATPSGTGMVRVYMGDGAGDFAAPTTLSTTGATAGGLRAADMNGDGISDIVASVESTNQLNIFMSNGDGTFASPIAQSTGTTPFQIAAADFNNDGAMDLANANYGSDSFSVSLAVGTTVTTAKVLDLTTRAGALTALTDLERASERLSLEAGSLGASESRLNSLSSFLVNYRDGHKAAEHRITDVDVAEETANLLKNQVIAQAASAMLAHSNQSLSLLTSLLE